MLLLGILAVLAHVRRVTLFCSFSILLKGFLDAVCTTAPLMACAGPNVGVLAASRTSAFLVGRPQSGRVFHPYRSSPGAPRGTRVGTL